jgi:hypothetical protein
MPKVVFTHRVKDVAHWSAQHQGRVEAFAPFASEVQDYVTPGDDSVAVSANVHDMDAMAAAMQTPEMQAAKDAHGVLEPIALFVENP